MPMYPSSVEGDQDTSALLSAASALASGSVGESAGPDGSAWARSAVPVVRNRHVRIWGVRAVRTGFMRRRGG